MELKRLLQRLLQTDPPQIPCGQFLLHSIFKDIFYFYFYFATVRILQHCAVLDVKMGEFVLILDTASALEISPEIFVKLVSVTATYFWFIKYRNQEYRHFTIIKKSHYYCKCFVPEVIRLHTNML